jgi:hypothetical protein
MSVERRSGMVEASHPRLSVVRQCALLGISRSGHCYRPAGESAATLALMRLPGARASSGIDEVFLEGPYYGSRQMVRHLRRLGHRVGRARVGPADAPDGPGRDLSEAEHQRPASGAPGLSLPAARPCDRAAQPGLVLGHHLHRYVRRTSRFGEARLARPAGAWPGQGGSACPVSTKSRIWPTF